MNYDVTLLEQGCQDISIMLTDEQKNQFLEYYEILVKWNKVMNLTAIKEYSEVLVKHFVDSLSIAETIDMNKVYSVIDVGTGAGFPGIPLKIAFPHLQITLLDSLKKRVGFLSEVIEQLHLNQIRAIHGRAEEYARQKEHRENYDLCVSRAVANLSTLSEYCLPYVKLNGMFVPYKSGKIQDELQEAARALRLLGGRVENVYKFNLADTNMSRSLVVVKKEKETPKKYPRKAGLPSKDPLK